MISQYINNDSINSPPYDNNNINDDIVGMTTTRAHKNGRLA